VFQQDGMVALVDSARNSYAPVGIPLTTRTEIRGFDRGLNAIDITRSDAEFSEDEQKAYTAATGNAYDPATVDLAVWSPEPRSSKYARMDPTLADTDADGFPDGWEYYFWYQAHVWVPADADGPGKPRNGQSFVFERFNVADILNGTQIPAAEVEARFNPCDPVDPEAYAKKPDFDNDGLSDLEELAIGTNPCHWDTDGDRMCDGWEVMMCLDPLGDSRSSNPDGDFMAFHQIGADYVYLDPAGDADPYAQGAVLYTITSPLTAGGDIDLAPPNAVALHDLHVKAVRFTPKYEGGENLVYGRLEDLPEEIQPDTAWGMYMVEGLERVEIDIPEGTTLLGGLTYVLVHDQVHQAFGFDPRTGWFRTGSGYVANRWDPMVNGDLRLSDVTGLAVNTRPYMTYDEYLVMRYRLQYGKVYPDEKGGFDNDKPWETLVAKTTNPNVASPKIVTTDDDAAGDGETTTGDGETTTGDGETETEETPASLIAKALAEAFAQAGSTRAPITTHGADTDGDGVPDGWELYMNRNPNAGPGEMEDGRGLPDKRDYDGDQLAYALEYAGTDSCNAYEGCDSIYKNHPGNASGWFNKFFPTNPGANRGPDMGDGADTDGDGILDILEGMTWRAPFFYEGQTIVPCEMGFIYGTPADDASCCIRGGGMNPCTVDTDQDGLPDGWEMQHAGVPVDLATRKPVPPVGGQVTIDLELSTATIIADGLAEAATEGVYIMGGMDATWGSDAITRDSVKDPVVGTIRDTDFDHDGLQNFQEYAVQSLRHFRYDDNVTPLMGRLFTAGAPHAQKFLGYVTFDAASPEQTIKNALEAWADVDGAPSADELAALWNDESWRKLGYFVPPAHAWDRSLTAAIMLDPVYEFPAIGAIVPIYGSAGYVSTDPRMADTDKDGMDDYYELFHGLNPILGTTLSAPENSPMLMDDKSGDIISTTYNALNYPLADSRATFNAWNNEWMLPDYDIDGGRGAAVGSLTRPTGLANGVEGLDPILYPWTMGSPLADADGDGMRNDEERILANATDPLPQHTDPTPRWFTERTTAASYTAQYYMTPERVKAMPIAPAIGLDDYAAAAYLGNSNLTYLYAFEENEGYDTDNDFAPDGHEIVKGVSRVTDPLRHDDPHRRQALYLNGVNSYAMSRDTHVRPVDAPDLFKQFTVECWVRPEKTGAAQTILERATAYEADANNKDKVAIRANFRLGLTTDGRVYGLFDNNDAIESGLNAPTSCQRLESEAALPLNAWSHVALSYDGTVLKLFVNGKRVDYASTTLIPANGVVQVTQDVSWLNTNGLTFAYKATPVAFFVGARPKKEAVEALTPSYVDPVTGEHLETFANVREFFKGYVDEVRAWDGARSEEEIAASYATRMDYKAISDNRDEVFRAWYNRGTRNNNDGNPTLPPELVLHYDFSTLPGALNAADVAQAPVGFTKMALGQATFDHAGDEVNATGLYPNIAEIKEAATGDGQLEVGWWSQCLQKSTVYKDYTVVPWIANSVARLPALDGASVDSEYYGENLSAGYVPPTASGVSKFVFPNTGLPYQGYVYNFDRALHLDRLARYVAATGSG
ncbi:MAG: LamG domain-containing protein, partial [Kiritimatiellae bacterium]|nr:LamG domain-containing protein [Kiritimatiellia bacterium]